MTILAVILEKHEIIIQKKIFFFNSHKNSLSLRKAGDYGTCRKTQTKDNTPPKKWLSIKFNIIP